MINMAYEFYKVNMLYRFFFNKSEIYFINYSLR